MANAAMRLQKNAARMAALRPFGALHRSRMANAAMRLQKNAARMAALRPFAALHRS